MYMTSRILKWGNSLGIRIPKAFAEETGVSAGSEVDFTVRDGELVIRPLREKRYSLAQLLDGVTAANLHAEVETGGPVGAESW